MTSINIETFNSDEELIQGSEEWFAARLGKITASRLNDLMKKTKYGESQYITRLRMELAIERITGKQANIVTMNKAMHDGVEREPDARKLFEATTGKDVALCGSFNHPYLPNTAASPDGLLRDENAILEIKCPTAITHANNLLSDKMPKNYVYQVQWQIACTESDYGYFCSYHPDFPSPQKLKWMKVDKDEKIIGELVNRVRDFDIEVHDLVVKLSQEPKNG